MLTVSGLLNNSMPVKKETSPESNKTSASNFASAFKSKVGQVACFIGSICCGIMTCQFIGSSQSMWVWNCPLVTVIICILSLLHVDKTWEMIHRILWAWEIIVRSTFVHCNMCIVLRSPFYLHGQLPRHWLGRTYWETYVFVAHQNTV